MIENRIINGLALETMQTFPDKFANCIITSPPYWQLRDYGYPEQWGLEPTFQQYLEHLWSLMDEVYRVLKDDGTVWINLGDTYSGSNGFGCNQTKWKSDDPYNKRKEDYANKNGVGNIDGIKPKCQLLIPHRFAIGCIERGWILRNDII